MVAAAAPFERGSVDHVAIGVAERAVGAAVEGELGVPVEIAAPHLVGLAAHLSAVRRQDRRLGCLIRLLPRRWIDHGRTRRQLRRLLAAAYLELRRVDIGVHRVLLQRASRRWREAMVRGLGEQQAAGL